MAHKLLYSSYYSMRDHLILLHHTTGIPCVITYHSFITLPVFHA